MSNGLKLCPQCGSAGVDFSALAGGTADCRGCRWHGTFEDLLVVPGSTAVDNDVTLNGMLNDLRQLLSGELGFPYLKYLMKWGFITGDLNRPLETIDRKALARYVASIARSIMVGLLEERSKVEAARAARKAGGGN